VLYILYVETDTVCLTCTANATCYTRSSAVVVIGLHVTQLYDANCYVARRTVSTGLVLNRRSASAEKYWIGPIHFWLDRVFSII